MRHLIDIVTHKHELIPFASVTDEPGYWQLLEVPHDGRTYRVHVPIIYDAGVERIVRVDDCGSLLYMVGEVGHDHANQGRIGCLIAAHPSENGSYRAFLFHSLYPKTIQAIPKV